MIGIILQFPNTSNRKKNKFRHRSKGVINLFLCSVYHPYRHNEEKELYEELDSFYLRKPRNYKILLGADIKCNFGTRTKMLGAVVGPD